MITQPFSLRPRRKRVGLSHPRPFGVCHVITNIHTHTSQDRLKRFKGGEELLNKYLPISIREHRKKKKEGAFLS